MRLYRGFASGISLSSAIGVIGVLCGLVLALGACNGSGSVPPPTAPSAPVHRVRAGERWSLTGISGSIWSSFGNDPSPHDQRLTSDGGNSIRAISELSRKRSKTISLPSGLMSNALIQP
jgi:hypothetical protein